MAASKPVIGCLPRDVRHGMPLPTTQQIEMTTMRPEFDPGSDAPSPCASCAGLTQAGAAEHLPLHQIKIVNATFSGSDLLCHQLVRSPHLLHKTGLVATCCRRNLVHTSISRRRRLVRMDDGTRGPVCVGTLPPVVDEVGRQTQCGHADRNKEDEHGEALVTVR